MLNVLNNAVKFTDEGSVSFSATASPVGEEGEIEVHMVVRDTGIGIPPDRIDRLFQSFSQADVSISRQYGGTGLGLAISKRLAEAMGGTMWAESDGVPGNGSVFHVTLRTRAGNCRRHARATAHPHRRSRISTPSRPHVTRCASFSPRTTP